MATTLSGRSSSSVLYFASNSAAGCGSFAFHSVSFAPASTNCFPLGLIAMPSRAGSAKPSRHARSANGSNSGMPHLAICSADGLTDALGTVLFEGWALLAACEPSVAEDDLATLGESEVELPAAACLSPEDGFATLGESEVEPTAAAWLSSEDGFATPGASARELPAVPWLVLGDEFTGDCALHPMVTRAPKSINKMRT